MKAQAIHVVGSINEDIRLGVEHHPQPGETITALHADTELGGKGANQAVAASRAGGDVRFIGAVGADSTGTGLRAALAAEGIDVSGVESVDGVMSGRAVVVVSTAGENEIFFVPGANATVDIASVVSSMDTVSSGDIVVLQLELPLEVVAATAREARLRGAFVVVNAAPIDVGILRSVPDVDLFVVNEHELAALLAAEGIDGAIINARAAAERLAQRLATPILCTFGADGSVLVGHTPTVVQPTRYVKAIDTTGAGDTFLGYVVASFSRGHTWSDALKSATAAAAIAVTREGAARSIPYESEVDIELGDQPEIGHSQASDGTSS